MLTLPVQIRRDKLPEDLGSWRNRENPLYIWSQFDDFFQRNGFRLWTSSDGGFTLLAPTGEFPSPGFLYTTHSDPRTMANLTFLIMHNALSYVARRRDGQDVVIRVIMAGSQGHCHRRILKKIATAPEIFWNDNHVLPMLQELVYQDITFGIFPRVTVCMERSICSWPKNSVDDIMDMIMQGLEGIMFLHERLVAHRDLFTDNFLLEWHPESMHLIMRARPRVYIIDFEVAVDFPIDSKPTDRLVCGPPFPIKEYTRPIAPELHTGLPYCPFLLDIWQFGMGFENLRTTIPEIDAIIESMRSDIGLRPTAKDILCNLDSVLQSLPLKSLQIAPLCTDRFFET